VSLLCCACHNSVPLYQRNYVPDTPRGIATPERKMACRVRCPMRMPVVSYFVVMSVLVSAALILVSSWMEPQPSPIATSQLEGLQPRYTPEPEPAYPVTATNFAAPRKASDAMAQANEGSKPFRPAKAKRKQDSDDDKRSRPARGHVADYPINGMMAIH
jgi:hypothetical protein